MSPGNDERRPGEGRRIVEQTERVDTEGTPTASVRTALLEHIAAVRDRCPDLEAVDDMVWAEAISQHLTPLPSDRPWRLQRSRHRLSPIGETAPAVVRRLTPGAGAVPQPRCAAWCAALHAADEQASA